MLEDKCSSYESQVLSLQQENDSLKLAMKIIMQERSEGECHQQKIIMWLLVPSGHTWEKCEWQAYPTAVAHLQHRNLEQISAP